jgi:hypothetical protein
METFSLLGIKGPQESHSPSALVEPRAKRKLSQGVILDGKSIRKKKYGVKKKAHKRLSLTHTEFGINIYNNGRLMNMKVKERLIFVSP